MIVSRVLRYPSTRSSIVAEKARLAIRGALLRYLVDNGVVVGNAIGHVDGGKPVTEVMLAKQDGHWTAAALCLLVRA